MARQVSTRRQTPAPARNARLADLATRLARTLALARVLAQSGRRLDLAGVEDGIGMLCAQTLDLDDDEARAVLPMLTEVLAQVDLLSASLRALPMPNLAPC